MLDNKAAEFYSLRILEVSSEIHALPLAEFVAAWDTPDSTLSPFMARRRRHIVEIARKLLDAKRAIEQLGKEPEQG